MATFYIDLVNGSDAAAGTSWATAWKTFTSGPTAARIAPGDTFRIAKSPDPVSLGSSTWTDNQIGGSIVFGSAITKEVDRCKASWVTMGAGSTVTNAQTTAWVTLHTDNIGKALQWVTSSTTNGCYKDLGSTQDFSGFRILNFWFRVSGTFDCTSSQDMVVELCSDAAATTVVNSITIPKMSYSGSLWYPIVADFGAALSSNVRSVRIRTAVATTLTFQVDEMFTSQANGLTLRSVIGQSSSTADWYPIRTIRNGTDVFLMARFAPGTATGACAITAAVDAAWRGTSGTYTAHKRDTILVPTTSANFPGNVENGTSSGSTVNAFTYSGGWNTGTTTQDGETWIDGLVQNAGGFSLSNSTFHNFWRIEKVGFVRTGPGHTTSSSANLIDNCSFVATSGYSFGSSSWNVFGWSASTSFTVKCYHGNNSGLTINGPAGNNSGACTYTIGNYWGNDTLNPAAMSFREVTIGEVYPVTTSAAIIVGNSAYRTSMNIAAVKPVKSTSAPTGIAFSYIISSWAPTDSVVNIPVVENVGSGFFAGFGQGATGSVFNIGTNTGTSALIGGFAHEVIFNNLTVGSAGGLFVGTINSALANQKMYFHNYGGVLGASRVYVTTGNGNNAALGMFELQGTDVYAGGSKAWKYSVTGMPSTINGSNFITAGCINDLKLAAVAAEADKLVTITARVKRSAAAQEVGLKLSGKYKLVPGYTDDVLTVCTSTGTFELLTVTFTPTEDCVFDVFAHVKLNDPTSLEAVWDDLQITQAA